MLGVGDGELIRDGDGEAMVGLDDAEGLGEADGDAVALPDGVTTPVQAMPLRAKAVGAGLLVVHAPLKPIDVLPLVAMAPL